MAEAGGARSAMPARSPPNSSLWVWNAMVKFTGRSCTLPGTAGFDHTKASRGEFIFC